MGGASSLARASTRLVYPLGGMGLVLFVYLLVCLVVFVCVFLCLSCDSDRVGRCFVKSSFAD